jgi:hypothetical protein
VDYILTVYSYPVVEVREDGKVGDKGEHILDPPRRSTIRAAAGTQDL